MLEYCSVWHRLFGLFWSRWHNVPEHSLQWWDAPPLRYGLYHLIISFHVPIFPRTLRLWICVEHTHHLTKHLFHYLRMRCSAVVYQHFAHRTLLQECLIQDICILICKTWLQFTHNGHSIHSTVDNREIRRLLAVCHIHNQSFPVDLYRVVRQTRSRVKQLKPITIPKHLLPILSSNVGVKPPGKMQDSVHAHGFQPT